MSRITWDPKMIDLTPGLDRLGEAFQAQNEGKLRARRLEIEDARQKASEEYTRGLNKTADKRAAALALQQQMKSAGEMADRNQRLYGKVHDMAMEGDYSGAEAMAKSSAIYDPETGERKTIGFEREDPNPEMRKLQLQPPPDAGAEPEPGQVMGSLLGGKLRLGDQQPIPPENKAAASMFGLDLKQPEAANEVAAGQELQGNLQQVRDEVAKGPRIAITSPTGDKTYIGPEDRENYKRQQAQRHADEMEAQLNDPRINMNADQRASLVQQIALIRGQATGGEAGRISNVESREDAQRNSGEQKALDRQNRLDVAKVRKASKGTGGPSTDEIRKVGVINKQVDEAVKSMVLDQNHYKEVGDDVTMLTQLRALAGGADVSPGFATLLGGRFAKWAQGAGVLTDKDMDVFYRDMEGLASKYNLKLNQLMTGTLTKDMQRDITQVLDKMASVAEAKKTAMGAQIAGTMEQRRNQFVGPNGNEEWKLKTALYIKQYSPGYLDKFEREHGKVNWKLWQPGGGAGPAPGAPGAAPGPAAAAGAPQAAPAAAAAPQTTAMEEDQKWVTWAKANVGSKDPKDAATAKGILAEHGIKL